MDLRRGRAAIAAVLLVAVAAVVVAHRGRVDQPRSANPPATPVVRLPPAPYVTPHVAFWQDPYMGVACPVPNSIACDRVGLAVWLRRPAVSVAATVAGVIIHLHTGPRNPAYRTNRPVRAGFGGYLQPAGLGSKFHMKTTPGEPLWFGERPPTPLVRFRIDYGDGNVVATHERVMIMAGWG